MQKKDIKDLLEKVRSGYATPKEEAIVKKWLHQLNEQGDSGLSDEDLFEARQTMWQAISSGKSHVVHPLKKWKPWAAAATVIFCLGVTGYLFYHSSISSQTTQNQQVKNDLLPGGNKAIITLANGQQIVLNGASNGKLANEHNTTINKAADGVVNYQAATARQDTTTTYNTMTTPKGGQYTLVLADGTKVILNAASSITYPVAFKGQVRRVKLIGEAYFEVTHNKAMPFHVDSRGQDIEVLGTHFNVNSYTDEPAIQTTLLEGSVKINAGTILKPGQQAILKKGELQVKEVDPDDFVAWKNGLFEFNNVDIQSVMRQFSRWYDVDIQYEGAIPHTVITGEVYRNMSASKALEVLKKLKIKVRIEGRKIILTN